MAELYGLLVATWNLLLEMSPYLLFGLLMAGCLHLILPETVLTKHLSGEKWKSVIKAALIGVPLPICSCGVIPVTAHIRKIGAGRGSVLSFLTSTPTSGVDSFFATYSLLGWFFAIIRIAAAFSIGIFSGVLANILYRNNSNHKASKVTENDLISHTKNKHSLGVHLKAVFHYAFFDLIGDIGKWLLIGIMAGGLISYFVPTSIIENYMGNPIIAYAIMLLIGLPMYVCSTGSIPIAATLILKGMSPGAGLVFLIVGPATNTATISFVGGKLGAKTLFIYLTAIILGAIGWGALLDYTWPMLGMDINIFSRPMSMLPYWLKVSSAIVLVSLIFRYYIVKTLIKISTGSAEFISDMEIKVFDMRCIHCKKTIEAALIKIEGIKGVDIDLENKIVHIRGRVEKETVINTIKSTGYSPE